MEPSPISIEMREDCIRGSLHAILSKGIMTL